MSVLLLTGAAAVGLAYLSQPDPVKNPPKTVTSFEKKLETSKTIFGRLGDHEQLARLLQFPGRVASVTKGQDLRGAPCRWIKLHNGAIYRTYDMDTPYL